jgi:IclR family transcriptional regulator, KDG regulon repressor
MSENIVKSLIKALDILQLVSEASNIPTTAQIAAHLKINRTTAYRLIQTLVSKGFLTKDPATNGFQIGLKILPIAAKLLDMNKLRTVSLPYLHKLALLCGERVNLGILDGNGVLYLAGVEKPSLPVVYSRFGKRAPAHCCSLGKIILANLPPAEMGAFLERNPLLRVTDNTITESKIFKKHMIQIRALGYAVDREEHIPGSNCIGVLLRGAKGGGIGAISISGGNLEIIKGHLKDLLRTAELISHHMGFSAF